MLNDWLKSFNQFNYDIYCISRLRRNDVRKILVAQNLYMFQIDKWSLRKAAYNIQTCASNHGISSRHLRAACLCSQNVGDYSFLHKKKDLM